jgi:uncharacterized cupin superfamily protein
VIELADAAGLAIVLAAVEARQVVSGSPSTGFVELGSIGGAEYGVWEMTPGAITDVEADEVFVVVFGAATVELVDDGTVRLLAAGSVGRLEAGMRTIWTVTETLRKVYFTSTSPPQAGLS